MSANHFIRLGALGHVGRLISSDGTVFARGMRVVCRTSRGLEIGQVLAHGDESTGGRESDGSVLRRMTVEDELLAARIEKNKDQAYGACAKLIASHGFQANLMEVELLFDGQSLFFYFLGEVTTELQGMTDELAEAYEAKVQFRRFTDTLVEGCGPDCGTDAASGCCSGSCAIAASCAAHG